MSTTDHASRGIASTGIPGLDDILAGGFARRRLFLIEGVPGSGKTTLALQYAIAAARRGEAVLYVTLSETDEELRAGAESHGWRLDGIEIRQLTPPEDELNLAEQNTMFHPSEVELASVLKQILQDVERFKPSHVVFDSLSELRLMAGSPLRYRRQILALKQFFATRECTVLLLDDLTAIDRDLQVQSIAHGVAVARTVESRVWLRAPASSRRQVQRRAVSRRLSRLSDQAGRARSVSETRRSRASAVDDTRKAGQRNRRARYSAGGWDRGGHEHADSGGGGNRQVNGRRTVRVGRGTARSACGDVPVRREPADPPVTVRVVECEPRPPCGRRPRDAPANRSRLS